MNSLLDNWELLGVAADAGLMYLLYKFYKSQVKEADFVQSTPSYAVGQDLATAVDTVPEKVLPYVCIEGVTKSVGTPLRSHYVDDELGVVQHLVFLEHKAKRTSGHWSDIKRTIKNTFVLRPFQIASAVKGGVAVDVTDPMAAEYLKDSLTNTHSRYTAADDTAVSRGIDRLFGEITKGFEESEDMLGIGVPIIAIGQVSSSAKKFNVGPPETGRYIISTLSKAQIVRDMKSSASFTKGLLWVFGIIGSSLFTYWLYRTTRAFIQNYNMRRVYHNIRQQREQQREANDGEDNDQPEDNACVVCLVNPREIVVLNCGHLCLCAECMMSLPKPQRCPICRCEIVRHISVYNP